MTTEQDSKPQIPTEIIVTKTRARYTKSKLEDLPPVDLPGLSKGHCVTVFVRTAHRTPQQQDVHLTCGPLPLRALCTFSPYIDAAVTKFRIRHLIGDQHTLQRVKAIYIVSDAFDGIDAVARYISKYIASHTTQLLLWGVEAHTPLSSLSAAADAAVYLGMHSMAAMLRSHFDAARYQPDRNRRRRKNDHALTPDKRWNPLLPDLLALTAQYPRDTAVRRAIATDIWSSIHDDAMHIDARTGIEEYIHRNGGSELAYDYYWARDLFDPLVESAPEYSEVEEDTEGTDHEAGLGDEGGAEDEDKNEQSSVAATENTTQKTMQF